MIKAEYKGMEENKPTEGRGAIKTRPKKDQRKNIYSIKTKKEYRVQSNARK